jgi:predicted outer membrane repeat protein
MYNVESSPALTKTTFSANTAGNGGGLYNDSGSPTLTNVTFSANTASSGGAGPLGGVSAASTAGSGGGLYNNYGSPTLTNVTFSGNLAGSLGGGMYNLSSLSPSLANVTFSANNAGEYGGGLYNDNSYPTVLNSILWGNTAVGGTQIYNFYSTPSLAYSDVQGGCPAGAACSNLISSDPLLGPLGTYGGGTQVFPLLPGSLAIDAGDDATCALTDQRNVSRWQGMGCDMGAFESRGFGLSITSGDGQTTHIRRAFALPLALSVSSAYDEPVDGGVIRFNLPASGPSAALSLNTVTISGGAVSVTATANNAFGKYTVAAGGNGGLSLELFHLVNLLYQVNLPLIRR